MMPMYHRKRFTCDVAGQGGPFLGISLIQKDERIELAFHSTCMMVHVLCIQM